MALSRLAPITLGVALLASALTACATRNHVFSDYASEIRETPQPKRAERQTTFLFLVDGLSIPMLERHLAANRQGALAWHFGAAPGSGRSAYAAFPSLTYPNIASILSGLPVSEHPIAGNQIVHEGDVLNFESPSSISRLNSLLEYKLLFTELARQHRPSVSLSYYLNAGSAASIGVDIKTGLAYSQHRFDYVDDRLIGALDELLSRTPQEKWPSFVFLHLVGVDGLAHLHGPDSPQVRDYLARLDEKLKPVLQKIRAAEMPEHRIMSVLTADHGFVRVERAADLTPIVKAADRKIVILNQGRHLGLHLPSGKLRPAHLAMIDALAREAAVEVVAFRLGNQVELRSQRFSAQIRYHAERCPGFDVKLSVQVQRPGQAPLIYGPACPTDLDRSGALYRESEAPNFITNIASYFRSSHHADIAVAAAPGATFLAGDIGQHGGITADEVRVPVLLRNAALTNLAPRPSYELTQALRKNAETYPLEPQNLLTVSAPVGLHGFTSRADGIASRTWSAGASSGLAIQFRQLWSKEWSWLVGHRIEFHRLALASLPAAVAATRLSLNRFELGAEYRFLNNWNLRLLTGAGQMVFVEGAEGTQLRKQWSPRFTFGTSGQLYSLGFGDLALNLSMSVLLKSTDPDQPATHTGFARTAGLTFSRPVRGTDLFELFAQGEMLSQDTDASQNDFWSLRLGVNYTIRIDF